MDDPASQAASDLALSAPDSAARADVPPDSPPDAPAASQPAPAPAVDALRARLHAAVEALREDLLAKKERVEVRGGGRGGALWARGPSPRPRAPHPGPAPAPAQALLATLTDSLADFEVRFAAADVAVALTRKMQETTRERDDD